jgi:hypothetical protein
VRAGTRISAVFVCTQVQNVYQPHTHTHTHTRTTIAEMYYDVVTARGVEYNTPSQHTHASERRRKKSGECGVGAGERVLPVCAYVSKVF